MATKIERKRLMKTINDEPANAWMVLAICAVGLAVVVLIAVIGYSEDANRNASPVPASTLAASTPDTANARAQAHRKQVFDERRHSFAGNAGRHTVASEAAEPSNRMSAVLH